MAPAYSVLDTTYKRLALPFFLILLSTFNSGCSNQPPSDTSGSSSSGSVSHNMNNDRSERTTENLELMHRLKEVRIQARSFQDLWGDWNNAFLWSKPTEEQVFRSGEILITSLKALGATLTNQGIRPSGEGSIHDQISLAQYRIYQSLAAINRYEADKIRTTQGLNQPDTTPHSLQPYIDAINNQVALLPGQSDNRPDQLPELPRFNNP